MLNGFIHGVMNNSMSISARTEPICSKPMTARDRGHRLEHPTAGPWHRCGTYPRSASATSRFSGRSARMLAARRVILLRSAVAMSTAHLKSR